jgi:hypothetical protein
VGCRVRTRSIRRAAILGVVVFFAIATVVARRRGYSGMGGRTLVRCRAGHLFMTLWVPGVSIKSLRLGWRRAQYCPVGRHWSLVAPVRDSDVSDEERERAREYRDIALP